MHLRYHLPTARLINYPTASVFLCLTAPLSHYLIVLLLSVGSLSTAQWALSPLPQSSVSLFYCLTFSLHNSLSITLHHLTPPPPHPSLSRALLSHCLTVPLAPLCTSSLTYCLTLTLLTLPLFQCISAMLHNCISVSFPHSLWSLCFISQHPIVPLVNCLTVPLSVAHCLIVARPHCFTV
jgi:hypothetical protein